LGIQPCLEQHCGRGAVDALSRLPLTETLFAQAALRFHGGESFVDELHLAPRALSQSFGKAPRARRRRTLSPAQVDRQPDEENSHLFIVGEARQRVDQSAGVFPGQMRPWVRHEA
jgi:hypothetical protein